MADDATKTALLNEALGVAQGEPALGSPAHLEALRREVLSRYSNSLAELLTQETVAHRDGGHKVIYRYKGRVKTSGLI
jgi:hypothetical protein